MLPPTLSRANIQKPPSKPSTPELKTEPPCPPRPPTRSNKTDLDSCIVAAPWEPLPHDPPHEPLKPVHDYRDSVRLRDTSTGSPPPTSNLPVKYFTRPPASP